MKLQETNKVDDLYFQGPFWIIGDSLKDILRGNFTFLYSKFLSDYEGNDLSTTSKNSKTHKSLWKSNYQDKYDVDYNYYPRGRVSIYKGTAFIHINSKCNTPKIINTIINSYGIDKLDIEIELNDEIQGSHYDFIID